MSEMSRTPGQSEYYDLSFFCSPLYVIGPLEIWRLYIFVFFHRQHLLVGLIRALVYWSAWLASRMIWHIN